MSLFLAGHPLSGCAGEYDPGGEPDSSTLPDDSGADVAPDATRDVATMQQEKPASEVTTARPNAGIPSRSRRRGNATRATRDVTS